MRTRGKTHLARSLAFVFGAALVIAGAGLATARTMSGPPWKQPLLFASCDPATATDGAGSEMTGTDAASDCTTTEPAETADPAERAAGTQTFFESFADECGTSVLGETDLTDAGADPAMAEAYGALVDALDTGQIDHMVQSVRVLLENCEAHPNDGLRTALYHHGVNWVRHYRHEVRLEQKFAEKWPEGKPGGSPHGADAGSSHGKPEKAGSGAADEVHGKPEKAGSGEADDHGNPHDDGDPDGAPGGSSGHGNAYGHAT
jgi:hypothetical protein